jgi:hypothetical protein
VRRRRLFVARWFSASAVSTDAAHVSELDGAAVALSWRQERQAARSSCLDMRPSQTRLGSQAYAVYERRERILRCPKCANARIVPVVYGYPVGSDPLHCVTPRGPFGAAVTGQLTCFRLCQAPEFVRLKKAGKLLLGGDSVHPVRLWARCVHTLAVRACEYILEYRTEPWTVAPHSEWSQRLLCGPVRRPPGTAVRHGGQF